jgi:hypothetical protein
LSLRATEVFVAKAEAFCQRVAGRVQALVPFRPDSNLVCLAFNPRGNARLAEANRFVRALQRALSADPTRPLQLGEYFGSVTTLKREAMGDTDTARLLEALGLPPDALEAEPGEGNDRLVILRQTLMNPFLLDEHGDSPVMDGYFAFLERWIVDHS